ncbi:MAG: HIT family protein [Candidatus Bipolaricaulota bacterium]
MNDCVFCRIVAGECPASVVYEDDVVLAFLDIRPVNPGHAMVIPKRHVASLADLDEATGRHLWTIAQRTTAALRRSGVKCEGVNLFLADGEAAFQEVRHVHLHVFPRYRGDPFKLIADWSARPPREDLDRIAAQIRTAYEQLRADEPLA